MDGFSLKWQHSHFSQTHFTNPLQEQCRTGTNSCSTSSNICLKPFFLANLCALRQSSWVRGGREALWLRRHHSWPPTVPSSCFLTAACISPACTSALFLVFCLLYMKVLTALENSFLNLLTLLCACKWGDLAFKRLNLERPDIRGPLGPSSLLAHHLSARNDSSNVPCGHQGLATFSVARFVCQH